MIDRRSEAWDTAQTILDTKTVMDYVVDDVAQAKCVSPQEYFDKLTDYLKNPPSRRGATMPFARTDDKLRFREGEMTLWGGINGHGKSLLLGQVAMGLIDQGHKVMVISLEMKPEATLARMCVQCCKAEIPSNEYIEQWMDYVSHSMRVVAHEGMASPDLIFACIRYAHATGFNHIVIDNLMHCVSGTDDYNAQKDFVVKLHELAIMQQSEKGCHIHLVHHIKKMDDELRLPSKFDLHGGVMITNVVDQCVIIYRNRLKEKKAQDPNKLAEAEEMPDTILSVVKNREGSWEGNIPLWFVPSCKQFVSTSQKRPIDLLPDVMPSGCSQ